VHTLGNELKLDAEQYGDEEVKEAGQPTSEE
jgi:hypothetical protein